MTKLKIIQWYTGEIARHQIRVIAACPSMELVGAYVHHEDKNGVDVGEIAGIAPRPSARPNAEAKPMKTMTFPTRVWFRVDETPSLLTTLVPCANEPGFPAHGARKE